MVKRWKILLSLWLWLIEVPAGTAWVIAYTDQWCKDASLSDTQGQNQLMLNTNGNVCNDIIVLYTVRQISSQQLLIKHVPECAPVKPNANTTFGVKAMVLVATPGKAAVRCLLRAIRGAAMQLVTQISTTDQVYSQPYPYHHSLAVGW